MPIHTQVKKSSKKTAKRTTSNIFGMFSQNQLSEFKQAFQFIDFDKDGLINKHDVAAAFDSLGKRYPDDEINSMISEAGGPVNYTTFIRLIGEKVYSGKTALSGFVMRPLIKAVRLITGIALLSISCLSLI